jgi:hypothetical protein
MSEAPRLSGGCLCGAVRFTATPKSHNYGVCHCSMCRRWAAGPFMAIVCGDTVKFDKDADLGLYQSSAWAERGFCKKCGTSLFYKFKGKDDYIVSTEAFDDTSDFKLVAEIYIDEKPANYAFANDTKKMTGAEVMAAVGPLQGGEEA